LGRKTERRHQQGEESRERILDATAEIAGERGYEGTTISLVSKRSGLPVSSIYWHFANKDELIAAVIRRSYDAWSAELASNDDDLAALEHATSREQLVAVMRREAGSLARHPDFLRFGLLLTLEHRDEEPAARRHFLEVRAETLQRIEAGYQFFFALHGVDVDADRVSDLSRLTMAAYDGIFVAGQATPDADTTPLIDLLATAIDLLVKDATA